MSIFTHVSIPRRPRSRKNLTHDVNLTTDFARLTPILCIDTVPGDRFKLGTEIHMKFSPLLYPIMSRVNVRVDYFFVPNRILWSNWQNFITRNDENGRPIISSDDSSELIAPVFTVENLANDLDTAFCNVGTLWDYLGLAPESDTQTLDPRCQFDILPFAAYQQIFNDWYRDENFDNEMAIRELVDKIADNRSLAQSVSKGDVDTFADDLFKLRSRRWQKDYFTSALPWAQRGDAALLPVGDTAPVSGTTAWNDRYEVQEQGFDTAEGAASFVQTGANAGQLQDGRNMVAHHRHDFDGDVDLSEATGISIPEFRRLNAIQKWLEDNARAGGRYIEQILTHFGVRTPDYRLNRAEYLGGTVSPVQVSEVLSQAATEGSPIGDYAGHASNFSYNRSKSYFCQEHGWIIGIMSVMPITSYSQGIPRRFTRKTWDDYYFPQFAHIGEQGIHMSELYAYPGAVAPDHTFGYQKRYAEYMYMESRYAGQMRTEQFLPWHLGRRFGTQPFLNKSFLDAGPQNGQQPLDRIFSITDDTDHMFVHLVNHVRARRPMPRFTNPRL